MRSLPHYCLLVPSNVYPEARVARDFLKSIRAVPANPATHITNRVIKTVGLEPNGTILSFRNITMNKQIQNGTNFIPATPELRALNITATVFKWSLRQSLPISEALKKNFPGWCKLFIHNQECAMWINLLAPSALPRRRMLQETFFQRYFVSLLIPCLKFCRDELAEFAN